MPNTLTGDFDAVLYLSVQQINGLLATLHQNSADINASPQCLHNATVQVSNAPDLTDGRLDLGGWLKKMGNSFLKSEPESGKWTIATEKLPPGAADALATEFAGLGTVSAPSSGTAAAPVKGIADVQISTPTITVGNNAESQLTTHVFILAHYYPNNHTLDLPSPIRGEVQLNYHVTVDHTPTGPKLKVAPLGPDDVVIFIPEPGSVTQTEGYTIEGYIAKAVRKSFQPIEVNLPAGFAFSAFKGIAVNADPSSQTIAIPVALSGTAPVGNIQSIQISLTGGEDFAFTVSEAYLNGLFQPLLGSLSSWISGITIRARVDLGVTSVSTVYHLRLTSGPTLTWRNGGFDLSIGIHGHTSSIAPDASITVYQPLTLVLNTASQTVSLQPTADPSVVFTLDSLDGGLPDSIRDDAENTIKAAFIHARDQVFPSASANINNVFAQALASIRSGLRSFDSSSSASFADLQVTVEGILVRGSIGTASRNPPYTYFRENADSYYAFATWVPGGRCKNYYWATSGITMQVADPFTLTFHNYAAIMPVPFPPDPKGYDPHGFLRTQPYSGIGTFYAQVCLTMEGAQVTPDGKWVENDSTGGFYSTGGSCIPKPPTPLVVLPPGWDDMTIPGFGHPGPVEDPLEKSILRHYSAASDVALNPEHSTNHVVHFADLTADKPLEGLMRALDHAKKRPVGYGVVVVLPVGSFQMNRREFEAKMGLRTVIQNTSADGADFPIPLHFTEDSNGAWSKTFDAKQSPATFLLNARGEYVWKHDGTLEPEGFSIALLRHGIPSRAVNPPLLDIGLRPGEAIPDIYFNDENGEFVALRRLRGRRSILNFWQSWSTPSLNELKRLQALHEKAGKDSPLIFAHCGDKEASALAKVRSENRLTLNMAHDANRELARSLKIRCWPTTIYIGANGIVEHIQHGAAQQLRVPAAVQ